MTIKEKNKKIKLLDRLINDCKNFRNNKINWFTFIDRVGKIVAQL